MKWMFRASVALSAIALNYPCSAVVPPPDFEWVQPLAFSINGDALDSSGNTCATGIMNGPNEGDRYVVVANDGNGTNVWTKQFGNPGGTAVNVGNAVACGESDNFYVTGRFFGTLALDSQILDGGNGAGFIVRYDKDGKVVWASVITPNRPMTISVDRQENLLVAGANQPDQAGAGCAKYSPNGVRLWVEGLGDVVGEPCL